MSYEKEFTTWLQDESYRVAQAYRVALWKELQDLKDIIRATPIIISHLRSVEIPKYNKYEGLLCKATQLVIYNTLPKVDFPLIRTEFINQHLKNN